MNCMNIRAAFHKRRNLLSGFFFTNARILLTGFFFTNARSLLTGFFLTSARILLQALAKLCVKWNCMNNSNNLHKP